MRHNKLLWYWRGREGTRCGRLYKMFSQMDFANAVLRFCKRTNGQQQQQNSTESKISLALYDMNIIHNIRPCACYQLKPLKSLMETYLRN